mgnify:CR=1 FL=1
MMEKRNVIEPKRTPEFTKQAARDKDEIEMDKLFKDKKHGCIKPDSKHMGK